MKTLYLIPARGGSKGIPNKNIKLLNDKPLINYTLEQVKEIADPKDICVSTDSNTIKQIVEKTGIPVPFLRPDEISGDHASSEDVIKHALTFYKQQNIDYDYVVMLQPTSPLRTSNHIKEAIELITDNTELIVSVKETDANPYYVLFSEEENKKLKKIKEATFTRRQDCPIVYELNGAVYVINVKEFLTKGYQKLEMTKYVMDKKSSVDIDDEIDFKLAGLLLTE